MNDARYVHALLHRRLTRAYDLFAQAFLHERKLKREFVVRACIEPGHRVLDLGAGTGTLAIMVKRAHPAAQVTGLDRDPTVVEIARGKAARASAHVTFAVGDATALPYPDAVFDRVLSSLVMSVLSTEQKRLAVGESHRVLRPGGKLVVADFGVPHTRWGRFVTPLVRRFGPIRGNLEGILPCILRDLGFDNVAEGGRVTTLFGTLVVVSGRRRD
jgi:ubiquinone/menaquinone biosynthesis C-methylase UbiE